MSLPPFARESPWILIRPIKAPALGIGKVNWLMFFVIDAGPIDFDSEFFLEVLRSLLKLDHSHLAVVLLLFHFEQLLLQELFLGLTSICG